MVGLLLGTLTLIFSTSVRSEPPSAHSKYAFKVSLANNFPIRLSPRINFQPIPEGANKDYEYCDENCYDCCAPIWRTVETEPFTLTLHEDSAVYRPFVLQLYKLGRYDCFGFSAFDSDCDGPIIPLLASPDFPNGALISH